MTEKLQQLTDELAKELSALDDATIEQAIEYQQYSAGRLGDLREYLIEQGMNSIWRVENVIGTFGTWRINLNMSKENGYTLASICINQKGIKTAQLYDIDTHDIPESIATDIQERTTRNFIEAVKFFQNLDYKELGKYVRGFKFCDENELKEQRKLTFSLKTALFFFKQHMEKNKK